jgi:biotin carboxylase
MSARRVVLLGSRSGALRAAARLGLEVFLLTTRPLGPKAADRVARHAPLEPGARAAEVLGEVRGLLDGQRPDAVLPVTEGTVELAAHVRAALGAPGASVEAARNSTDKIAMKQAAAAAGLPVTEWEVVRAGTDARDLLARLGSPVVMKRARSSGSRGLCMARDAAQIGAALDRCDLAERFVEGREMSVELLFTEREVLFANPTEYLVPLHANIVPAALDGATWAAARTLAERAVRAMGLARGLAHVELFLTRAGPLFGEIAARPPGGRLMQLIQRAYGFDPWEALLRIELGERPALPRAPRSTAGVWMLHPGEGRVRAVSGAEEAAAVPGVTAVRCRVAAGDRVARREGSGQDIGYIEARGRGRDDVAGALLNAHETLRIELD